MAVRMFFRQRLAMSRAASVAGGGMAPGEQRVNAHTTTVEKNISLLACNLKVREL